jgi:hypothetical protein
VKLSTKPTSRIIPSQIYRSAGIPSSRLTTATRTAGGAFDEQASQVNPLLRPRVSPSMIPFIPNVITTAGTDSSAMPSPLINPTPNPRLRASNTAQRVRSSRPREVVTSRMAAAFNTQGTERSMPAMRTTNICPAATKPTKEATVSTAWTLLHSVKPGRTIPPTTKSRIAAPNAYAMRRRSGVRFRSRGTEGNLLLRWLLILSYLRSG